ncbi:T9SS type A sorting domain-containing protein [Flavobacterium sp.]|uniref:T9SS type A sorting domain-containing protein n=1 Tax=Flavobacterium sp. TaxID=239 RepID=UPI0025C180E8|nr:T9SS type A sorting domain-containing protein [Flavobacterium sp.]
MKKTILLAAMSLFGMIATAQTAGTVTMGPAYGNQVYYKLATQAQNAYPNNSWDIAFYRVSAMSMGVRTNEAKGILTYEVGPNSTWSTVDVSQEANWTSLNNSDTAWEGAFDRGTATYGWGEYNVVTHHVVGSVVFVLKTGTAFKKIKIDDYFGGYTFTFSDWTGTAWTADQTVTVANSASADRFYNYYSFTTNGTVIAEPINTEWDLLFTKYNADYYGDGSLYYPVTGVLTHPTVQVSENVEPTGIPASPTMAYSTNISTIGYDWKTFNGTGYTINTNKAFYVKLANGTVYRLVFATFEGSATGVITFNYQDVTSLSTEELGNKVTFAVYPNPTPNKRISIVYDVVGSSDKNTVSIYSLTGAKVYDAQLPATGFSNSELDLSNLNSGVYILKFQSGEYSTTKKIVLQ